MYYSHQLEVDLTKNTKYITVLNQKSERKTFTDITNITTWILN